MDIINGTDITTSAINLVLKKTGDIFGMLFPYVGSEKKAVDAYQDDIKNSDMSPETKAFLILNTKKTFKHIKNQKSIADIAIKNAKEGTDFSYKSGVREEWLERFMDSARFVSSEDLQLIWGKILANEFENPGNTPPNMIRILSEITPDMAKAFQRICSMYVRILPLNEEGNIEGCFKQIFVPHHNNDEKLREIGVDFNILNELEALGVLKFEPIVGYISKGIHNKKVLLHAGDKLDLIEKHEEGSIPIGDVKLNSVGVTLKSITNPVKINDYHDMVKNYLLDKGVYFANEHDFVAKVEGNTLHINRKNGENERQLQ